jgi:hypothetical protein
MYFTQNVAENLSDAFRRSFAWIGGISCPYAAFEAALIDFRTAINFSTRLSRKEARLEALF